MKNLPLIDRLVDLLSLLFVVMIDRIDSTCLASNIRNPKIQTSIGIDLPNLFGKDSTHSANLKSLTDESIATLYFFCGKLACMSSNDNMTEPEKQVADCLEQIRPHSSYLWWKYQFPVFVYDEKNRPRVWTPDFFLPKLGIYIEVCGSSEFNYDYREKVYDKNGYAVIFVHVYKESKVWRDFLVERIQQICESRYSNVKGLVS